MSATDAYVNVWLVVGPSERMGGHRNVWDYLRRGELARVVCHDCGAEWIELDFPPPVCLESA